MLQYAKTKHLVKRVHFDRSEYPLSPAKARNRGVSQTTGQVIAFIDADCIAHPDWLATLVDRFSDPQVNIVGGGIAFEDNNYWTLSDNLSMFYEYYVHHPPGERGQLASLNLAIRRWVFEQAGGFDERYPLPSGEDADLTIRIRRMGFHLYFEPRAVVLHVPPRYGLWALLRHGYFQGKYSTKVDHRHHADQGVPWPLRSRLGLALSALFLAGGATLRIYTVYPNLRRFWYTAPAVYLAKISWCLGAITHPNWSSLHGL